jgi:hypothetical protein
LIRKSFLAILAMIPALALPLATRAQVSPTGAAAVDQPDKVYKYSAYVGYSYSSLNQVNQSRYGLQGINASVQRDFGRFFGVTAEGDYYKWALGSGNPGDPSIQSVFFGPVLHANIYGKVDGFFHVLLGGEHTGGESETPRISFAGGVGAGVEYKLDPHFSVRASGDYIGASFSLINNSSELGNSPHKTWNSRGGIGVVYHF